MMRYFKKSSPNIKVMLAEGSWLQFMRVDPVTGVFATEDANILGQIDAAIAGQRGGMTEIAADEFKAFIQKKKKPNSTVAWREEFKNPVIRERPYQIPMEHTAPVDAGHAAGDTKPTIESQVMVERPKASRR